MKEERYRFLKLLQDFDERLKHMDRLGIEAQVLSIALPGADAGTPKESIRLSRLVNDYIGQRMKRFRGRFYGFASLPLLADKKAAITELERAICTLEFSGVEIYSNVKGKPVDDQSFWKIYERMESLGASLYIHPTTPYLAKERIIRDYHLWGPAFGYTFDGALAALRFINSGILEKFQKLKVMIAHLGECLPYIIDRIDWSYARFPNVAPNLRRRPHEYLKMMYVDTAGIFSKPSLECAAQVLDTSKIVFGSDYPFESLDEAVDFVKNSKLTEAVKQDIFTNNGKRFLGI